jgi:hypothetical protein
MINKETGQINFPGWNVSLSPSLTRERFLKSSLAKGAKVRVKNEPYCSWSLVPTKWEDDKWWHTTVFFKGKKLYQVNLAVSDNERGSQWKDWSEQLELRKKDYYMALIDRLLGFSAHHSFPWGSIEAVYEEKTGSSHIIIKY